MLRTTGAVALAMGLSAMCWAGEEEKQAPTLGIGDKAPEIDIAHWLKGEKVPAFESGKIYVMEFWATWCPPCRTSIPHLTELQEQFLDYDVTIIGVSDEKLQTVVEFLGKTDKKADEAWSDRIHYTLATDPDRSVHKSYMKAADQRGIPTAFIVGKDQRIEWIGHPIRMDAVLEAVSTDTWDRETFKMIFDLKRAAGAAKQEGEYEEALALTKKLIELDQDNRAGHQYTAFLLLLGKLHEPEQAYAVGHELIQNRWDEAGMLNAIAWYVVDSEEVKTRDLEFALKVAMRANELTESKDAAILDTVARVFYEKGDLTTAIKWQKKAVENAEGGMAESLQETLDQYEAEANKY
jgi:thiol-disulfide isomerase/thioredoxin